MKHYQNEEWEAVDVIRDVMKTAKLKNEDAFLVANALKYMLRMFKKGDGVIDIKKAHNYLHRYVTGEWYTQDVTEGRNTTTLPGWEFSYCLGKAARDMGKASLSLIQPQRSVRDDRTAVMGSKAVKMGAPVYDVFELAVKDVQEEHDILKESIICDWCLHEDDHGVCQLPDVNQGRAYRTGICAFHRRNK